MPSRTTKTTPKPRASSKNARRTNGTSGARNNTKQNRKTNQGSFLRKEIVAVLMAAFAVIALMGIFGIGVGFVGTFFSSFFIYGFGIGALLPAIALLYWSGAIIYGKKVFALSIRGCTFTALFALLVTFITLWNVPEGQELATGQLVGNGGILGGFIASAFRQLLGDAGSILLTSVLVLCCILAITRLSLRPGLHKATDTAINGAHLAKDKAAVGANLAKAKAGEGLAVAKEHIKEWKEQREVAKRGSAYDQEKDPRYPVDRRVLEGNDWGTLGKRMTEDGTGVAGEGVAGFMDTSLEDLPRQSELHLQERSDTEEKNVPSSVDELPVDATPAEHYDASLEADNVSEGLISDSGEFDAEAVETVDVKIPEPEAHGANVLHPSLTGPNSRKAAASAAALAATVGTSTMDINAYMPTFEGTAADTAAVSVSTDDGPIRRKIEKPYRYPSLNFLARGKAPAGMEEEVAHNATLLENTLESFGIKAHIINATQGPAVTRYELEPAPGVKVSKIVNLTDDIALNLAAAGIRMEAPIPGKAAIGIEIPNKIVSSVNLRDVLECDEFLKAKGGIPVGLGKDIAGKPIITDLAKMPHLLVAGSTGSGKSVCINTLISSILFSRKPDEVKLILIDPKMVELSNYNGVPHLMTPVVTDMKKATSVLRWAVKEMESRYRAFAATGVKDIKRYNDSHPQTAMPLIVLIIDELADLMMVSPVDIEDSICRLAQMARAAGIHLVLATQRPSVDVITGTIKANVPSRISFAVSSQIDSRTILDMAGAEKLLGKGDMLFNPIGASKPLRIQGAFISDEEVEHVVAFLKEQGTPEYDTQIMAVQEAPASEDKDDFFEDELLERAVDLVMDSGSASVSMLQRRFRIGYTRAARLVDTMEEMKIVGPNAGSKAREILMTRAEVHERYFSAKDTSATGHVSEV